MTECAPIPVRETCISGDVVWLATCPCGWIRWAPDETTARMFAEKHKPKQRKET